MEGLGQFQVGNEGFAENSSAHVELAAEQAISGTGKQEPKRQRQSPGDQASYRGAHYRRCANSWYH